LIRLAIILTIPIALLCLTLSLTARALGGTQPPHPVLCGFVEGCESKLQPCWYGIVPGVTTTEEAQSLLEQYGLTTQVHEVHSGLARLNELTIVDSSTLFGCEISLVDPLQSSYKASLEFRKCNNLMFGELYFFRSYALEKQFSPGQGV